MHVYTFLDGRPQSGQSSALIAACTGLHMRERSGYEAVRTGGPWPRRLLFRPDRDHIYQAVEFATARLTAFLVCLAPPPAAGVNWRQLDRDWRAATQPHSDDGVVGRVRLFYALYEGTHDEARLAEAIVAALPDGLGPLVRAPTMLFDGCSLWEAAAEDPQRIERVLVLLAPSDRETDSDALVWPSGPVVLGPLPAYLWEMAVVRHQARRFAERRYQSRVDSLIGRAERFEYEETSHPRRSASREATLSALRREVALVAAHEAVLRTMHRTVDAAVENALSWLARGEMSPVPPDGSGHSSTAFSSGPLSNDRQYARWLLLEIADTADTVRDAVNYAEPMARIGSAETEQRLQEHGARTESLSVLQTSVIAAGGLLLAAAQTVDVPWPTYASLKAPFIACLTAAALLIPVAQILRARPGSTLRRAVTVLTSCAFAASSGWLVTTSLVRWRTGHPAPDALSGVAALTAGVLTAAIAGVWWMVRARRVPR
ncbi:CATRA conflict system CASPASE/TPR repeat-associated protein [Micromonospora sp. NPDC049903]|uniref:CATRA conflict system CASPASE/TPR repeat-associated protein n=1 Tax=Micromonospora sp. NPDC049903 TaxID=3364276 RepID=UPI00379232AE